MLKAPLEDIALSCCEADTFAKFLVRVCLDRTIEAIQEDLAEAADANLDDLTFAEVEFATVLRDQIVQATTDVAALRDRAVELAVQSLTPDGIFGETEGQEFASLVQEIAAAEGAELAHVIFICENAARRVLRLPALRNPKWDRPPLEMKEGVEALVEQAAANGGEASVEINGPLPAVFLLGPPAKVTLPSVECPACKKRLVVRSPVTIGALCQCVCCKTQFQVAETDELSVAAWNIQPRS